MNDEEAVVSGAQFAALRQRAEKSAKANAWLRLLNGMLTRLSSAKGLDQVVSTILTVLMDTIGGLNLVVYYTVEGRWHRCDSSGAISEMPTLANPIVIRAVESRAHARSEPQSDAFPVGDMEHTNWVFPLLVQQRVIGAVAMEGMQLTDPAIARELQPFFVYAALMLGNEISNYSELERAHRGLQQAHDTLAREIAARRDAEEFYRTLFEQSPDGVVLVDPRTGKFVGFNPAAHEHLGYTREQFSVLGLGDILATTDTGSVQKRTAEFFRGPQTFETSHRTRNGQIRQILVSGKALQVGGVTLILSIFRDITDAKKLEEELLRSQKLESVGLLAGGIAHDFNNYLMAILGNVALAGQAIPPDSPAAALLRECETACARARDLTQHLLTFSKGGTPIKALSRIDALVRESALFASRGSGVRCDFEIPDDLRCAEIDKGQISQVIHNLVINAVQAMPNGGVIRIRCANIAAPADGTGTPAFVRIDIEDRGVGIPSDHLPKIFDPYFTTKQTGSGLGLASAHSVVDRHRGRIDVDSTLGEGTTFRVYLPAAGDAHPVEVPAIVAGPSRCRRVLVMDDDAMVRRVVSRMLSQIGCVVQVSLDGAEAIAAYETAMAAGEGFDLVILDLTVPGGMGGRDTLVHLKAIDPGVRALVSSGYSDDATIADCAAHGFAGVLQKPYNFDDLQRALAALPS